MGTRWRRSRWWGPALVAAAAACGGSNAPGDAGGAAGDAAAGDGGTATPTRCADSRDAVPVVTSVDPASGCPATVRVEHAYSGPGVCDTITACCTFPPACVFSARVALFINGPCGGLERSPPQEVFASGCRCVDGHVTCSTYPGAVANACLDCFIGSAGDAGPQRPDVPVRPDVPTASDVPSAPDD